MSVADDGGKLEFITATGQLLVDSEAVQTEYQAGPCVESFRGGLPLVLDDHRIGSLNVYDTKVRDWTRSDLSSARVLADMATANLVHAGQLAEARQLSEQLQYALDSRIIIEQAKGMLSRDHSIPVDDAFDLLRRYARSHNLALRDVARSVVESGLQIPRRDGGA